MATVWCIQTFVDIQSRPDLSQEPDSRARGHRRRIRLLRTGNEAQEISSKPLTLVGMEPVLEQRIIYPGREFIIRESSFTKRELRPDEWITNTKGDVVKPQWARERLQNEKDSLEFIAKHTTIPVPRVLDFFQHDGAWYLVTEFVPGVTLDNLYGETYSIALSNTTALIEKVVLP